MSINKIAYLKCVRGAKLTSGAIHVLTVLFTYSGPDGGNIRPGITRLAGDCGMGVSTVKGHLKVLTQEGFIARESRGGRRGDDRTDASVYRLALPANFSKSENLDFESVPESPDLGSQSPDLDSQSPDLRASKSRFSDPIKVLPSNKASRDVTPGEGAREAHARVPVANSVSANQTDDPLPGYLHRGFLASTEEPELGGIIPPSRYCHKHQPNGTDDNCHGCGRARVYRDTTWPTTPDGFEYAKSQSAVTNMARRQGRSDAPGASLAMLAGRSVAEMNARTRDLFDGLENRKINGYSSNKVRGYAELAREVRAEEDRATTRGDRKVLGWLELGHDE